VLLSEAEAAGIDARIARLEARCGVQVVAAVVVKSDAYPETVWKAFALGAALSALAVALLDAARADWMSAHAALAHVLPIIGIAATSALGAVFVPAYARLFVGRLRAEAEVRQRAQALFLERQLFRTRARNGVLVFASLFERRVEVIADIGFDGRVTHADWQAVVDAIKAHLASGRPADAIGRGLDRLESLLAGLRIAPDPGPAADELPNRPIEEGGA
jgi:putative membrane protein